VAAPDARHAATLRAFLAAILMRDAGLVTCQVCGAEREDPPAGSYPTVPHATGCPVADFDREIDP
jgi:hypothetical protein